MDKQTSTSSISKKTKWQELMDSPKGFMEYNPNQSFALHVYWVVRSVRAAEEMIERGFFECANATKRDTPTTLAYFFRISRNQKFASALKNEVVTIGQHPHYQASFKSLDMGLPRPAIETKLRLGGIDLAPLSWERDEPLAGHENELDYDPIVLECTEIYLDKRSFYEHGCSRDWMQAYPEIMKACRSLKPTTFCLGYPSEEIWEQTLEPSLKAIRVNDVSKQTDTLQPGLFFGKPESQKYGAHIFFLEMDFLVDNDTLEAWRSSLSLVQAELEVCYMLVLPTTAHKFSTPSDVHETSDANEVTVMICFTYSVGMLCDSLVILKNACANIEGELIVFDSDVEVQNSTPKSVVLSNKIDAAQNFLEQSGLNNNINILDGFEAAESKRLAGYPLHPLFLQLVPNEQVDYKI